MEIRLATEADDPAIRQLLQQIPLNGTLCIRYLREPSYMNSVGLQGIPQQTLVGLINDRIMAVASRNLQKLYINGEIKTAAYISNLRFHPDARHGIRLLKGLRYMESLPLSPDTDFHFATLISSDRLSAKILVSNRPRMPEVFDMGGVNTFSIPVKRNSAGVKPGKRFEILSGDEKLMPLIADFLKKEGVKRDFFPVVDGGAYAPELLEPASFFAIFDRGDLAGVCSLPYMKSYRQYIMEDYSRSFSLIRVPLNMYYNLRGLHSVPRKGENIKLAFMGFPVVRDDCPDIFRSLVSHVYNSLSTSGQHYLSIALHEKSPLIRSLSHFPKINYTSRLYAIKLNNDKFTAYTGLADRLQRSRNIPFIDLPRL